MDNVTCTHGVPVFRQCSACGPVDHAHDAFVDSRGNPTDAGIQALREISGETAMDSATLPDQLRETLFEDLARAYADAIAAASAKENTLRRYSMFEVDHEREKAIRLSAEKTGVYIGRVSTLRRIYGPDGYRAIVGNPGDGNLYRRAMEINQEKRP